MKRLVIFDLDGTLVNTLDDLSDSVNFALSQSGFPTHNRERFRYFVGNGIYKLIERALPENRRDSETVGLVKSVFMEHYSEHCTGKSLPYHGIDQLLQTLKNQGIKLAVASNKVHPATVAIVEHFWGKSYFDLILGHRDGKPTKPDPEIISDILTFLDVEKTEVLYAGDSGVDMQTAHNAGVTAIGVTWGLRTREELEENSADFIVDSPMEIAGLADKGNPTLTGNL